jgi:DNA-binding IscR family transcriptional regulator
MISRKGKYAIRAALFLAREHGRSPVSVGQIAAAEKIGKHGGYVLNEPPNKLTLGRIIRVIDGPLAPVRCVSVTAYKACEDCLNEATCPIRMVMKHVREAISRVLDTETLDEILGATKRLKPGGRVLEV